MSPLDASARAEVERLFATDAPVRLNRLARALDALADGTGSADAAVFEAHALRGAAAIVDRDDIDGLCRSIEECLANGVPPRAELRALARRARDTAAPPLPRRSLARRLVPHSFMAQLAAILLLTVTPAFGISIYDAVHQRHAARALIVRETTTEAEISATSLQQLVDGGRRLLVALRQTLELPGVTPARCSTILARIGPTLRPYLRFGVITADGHVVCSSQKQPPGFTIAGFAVVRTVRSTGRFAVGPPQRNPSGQGWFVLMGLPLGANALHGAEIGLALSTASIQSQIDRVELPGASSVTVFDRNAFILARRPDPARFTGTKDPVAPVRALDPVAGTTETSGADGVQRLFSYHAAGPWYVSVGTPTAPAYAKVMRALVYEVLLIGGLGAAGLGLGLLGARRALGRPLSTLASTARRLGQGDLAARTGLELRGGELQELASSIDAMAGSLEMQVTERDRAAADLERLAGELSERVHDRTVALEAALEEADRASRAKTAFLSRLSHELRTPLNAIRGFSQLLRSAELSPEQSEAAGHIAAGAEHMTLLVDELLDTARIEAGEFRVELERVAVGEIVREAVELSRGLAAEHGVAIEISVADVQLAVVADPARLEQVLLNLIKNAVVYNRRGGTVSVRMSRTSEGRAIVDVLDTGTGIALNDLERVFTPYDRLGRGPESDGLGLGLALSRRLVEAMGGTIEVESEPGVGSRFSVELAAAEAEAAGSTPVEQASASTEGRPPRRVLYIEDNATSMKLVELLLRGRDIDFTGASTGAAGIAAARALDPHLILLDLQLPDQTGEDVLRTLRAESSLRAVPIVMLSAQASRDTVRRLLEAGADDYLTKPLEIDRAADLIERLLHRGES